MDGVLFVAFFFPLLVSFNIAASSFAFSFAFWCTFGQDLARVLSDESTFIVQHTEAILGERASRILFTPNSLFLWILSGPPIGASRRRLFIHTKSLTHTNDPTDIAAYPIALPLFVNFFTLFTVGTTYGIGGAMQHAKNGWSFVQPMRGGARFVLIQLSTWTAFTLAVVFPWVAVEDLGFLRVFGFVVEQDRIGSGSLAIAGAGLGLIANTLAVLGVMSYDPQANLDFDVKRDLRNLDRGRWRWDVFGEGQAWWWLFMMSQFSLVLFSLLLTLALDNVVLKDKIIEGIVLSVLTLLLAVPVAVTNAVAGKWKHGTMSYKLYMPGRGGRRFAFLQALGWIAFALSTLATLLRLGSLVKPSESLPQSLQVTTRVTASLGFASFCFIFLSLFFFDKSDVVAVRQRGSARDLFADVARSSLADEETGDDEEEKGDARSGLRRRRRSKSPAASRTKNDKKKKKKKKAPLRLERIVGKRQRANGTVEYLVTWMGVSDSGWVSRSLLLKDHQTHVGDYERECEEAARRSLAATNESTSVTADLVHAAAGVHWEECEDEFGNIFYYNTQTGQSVVPEK